MEHTILGAIEDNALEDGEHAVGINRQMPMITHIMLRKRIS